MKIKGNVTRVDDVVVDVSADQLFEVFMTALIKTNGDLKPFDHIHDGVWQEFWFTDGHNGDDKYKTARQATGEEIVFDRLCRDIRLAFYRKAVK